MGLCQRGYQRFGQSVTKQYNENQETNHFTWKTAVKTVCGWVRVCLCGISTALNGFVVEIMAWTGQTDRQTASMQLAFLLADGTSKC